MTAQIWKISISEANNNKLQRKKIEFLGGATNETLKIRMKSGLSRILRTIIVDSDFSLVVPFVETPAKSSHF